MTSFVIKLIAIIAMFIDHSAKMFGHVVYWFPMVPNNLVQIMQVIGRLTFPIMAFFIAEGCRKTSSITKYMLRLFGFALIAQIPYMLAFRFSGGIIGGDFVLAFLPDLAMAENQIFDGIGQLNILFTLGFGVLTIFVYEKTEHKILSYIFTLLIIVAAGIIRLEYSWLGILLIFVAYVPKARRWQLLGMAIILSYMYLVYYYPFSGIWEWLGALTALPLLYFYNGERGAKAKYLFYAFYPAHLLLLVALREFISIA